MFRVSVVLRSQYGKNAQGLLSLYMKSRTKAKTCCVLFEDDGAETTPLLWIGKNAVEVSKRAHIVKAFLYAVQNFYAFMIM